MVIDAVIPDRALLDLYPTEESVEPVEAVSRLLAEAGHLNPYAWQKQLHPDALNPEIDADKRRFLVNRVWRVLIGMLEEDTTSARYCLLDQGSLRDWLILFKQQIVPLAVKHQLPNLAW